MIVDVPAVSVRFVDVVNVIGVEPLNVNADDPRLMLLVLELLESRLAAVTAKLPVLNAPLVTVMSVVTVRALPSVHPPPTPSKTTEPAVSVTPFVVMVLPVAVAAKVIVPV